MEKILFEDATLTSQAKVTIDGVDHLVTEAEYSGGTDLNANTFNQLQDNVENAIEESKLEEYSTSEQRIGTWIDGKPLYRRVFTRDITNSTETSVSGLQNIDFISLSDKSTTIIRESESYHYCVPFSAYETNTNWSKFYIVRKLDDNSTRLCWVGNSTTGTIVFVAEYTKTTD